MWQWSVLLLALSLGVMIVAWSLGFPFFFVFLFIPIIPFLQKEQGVKRCPVCGWETTGRAGFCPYDGTRLVTGEVTATGT
jgi:hypothetical protein